MLRKLAGLWFFWLAFPISAAGAYDGPAGVTLRAPVVKDKAAARGLRLGDIQLQVEAGDDTGWTLEKQGKNRAFPGKFLPTRARSWMKFSLENTTKKEIETEVLLPFDASAKKGTGFTDFLSFTVVRLDGNKPVEVTSGPEKIAHMFALRTRRFRASFRPGKKTTFRVTAEHRLALNPAWYRFVCRDRYLRVPNTYSLVKKGCALNFIMDDKVKSHAGGKLEVLLTLSGQNQVQSKTFKDGIRLSAERVEWMHVHPQAEPRKP